MSEAAAPTGLQGSDATPPAGTETPPAGTQTTVAGGDGGSTVAGGDKGSTVSGGNSSPWYGTIEDAELKGWVENKGFKDPITALQSMKNQEKLIGGDKVAIPKSAEDKEAWDAFYKAAGRPEKSEDYQLPVPEGDDGKFAGEAGQWMHELGLNTQQARGLAEKWNAHIASMQETQKAQDEAASAAEWQDLKKEWGGEYATNLEQANRVNQAFDIKQDELNAVLSGNEAMLTKILKRVGDKMLEDKYQDGDGGKTFTQTKEGAQAEIKELRNDKDFMQKFNAGDVAAKSKMKDLYKRAYPDKE